MPLWQDLALRWLGGEGSAALASDVPFHDRFPVAVEARAPAFLVARLPAVSHRAMLCVSESAVAAELPSPAG